MAIYKRTCFSGPINEEKYFYASTHAMYCLRQSESWKMVKQTSAKVCVLFHVRIPQDNNSSKYLKLKTAKWNIKLLLTTIIRVTFSE